MFFDRLVENDYNNRGRQEMPIYEYVCSKCGSKFELLRSLSQSNEEASCPQCHQAAKRVLSTFVSHSTDDMGFTKSLGGSSCPSCDATSCDSCSL